MTKGTWVTRNGKMVFIPNTKTPTKRTKRTVTQAQAQAQVFPGHRRGIDVKGLAEAQRQARQVSATQSRVSADEMVRTVAEPVKRTVSQAQQPKPSQYIDNSGSVFSGIKNLYQKNQEAKRRMERMKRKKRKK